MIYTFTLNTAIDKIMKFDHPLKRKANNKTIDIKYDVGGKATHVSVILSQLSIPNIATGFIGSSNGKILTDLLENKYNVTCKFIEQEGETRVSHILIDNSGEGSYMLTQKGFEVSKSSLESLFSFIKNKVKSDDICIFAGSPPPGIETVKYKQLLKEVKCKGAKLIVDASGDYLKNAIKVNPYLIKPNEDEFQELLNTESTFEDEYSTIEYLDLVHKKGAENIVLSLGKRGSILSTKQGEIYRISPPNIKEVNDTGCGDSFVGGIVSKLENCSLKEATVFGTAISASKATREESSGFNEKDISNFLKGIIVKQWR